MSESITSTLRGRVVTPDAVIDDAVVALAGDRISWVGAVSAWPDEAPLQSNSTIMPGLIDVHCHGGGGASFPDSAQADLMTAVRHHRGRGTTTMLASLVSASPRRLVEQTSMLADLYESGDIAGVHLEGPFLSVARCGAQDPASLRGGDTGLLADIIDAGRGAVRSMTLAPEVDGFTAVGRMLRENGIVPSIGHTDADARTTRSAIDALGEGAIGATHLFNGMPTWHHRSPGPVSECLAAAARGSMVLEMIGDGVHLADETVRAVFD
ncbi:amidohydrolase family protein, partial [Rhodococcus fascians]|nr:amidohydrolase family protein [Rhodococcus fascians]